jgi:hypothetical protein
MSTSFYDTVVLDTAAAIPIGVQVLTSPPHVPGVGLMDYTPLLEEDDSGWNLLNDDRAEERLLRFIQVLASPRPSAAGPSGARYYPDDIHGPGGSEPVRPEVAAFAERLFTEANVAVEMSPLSKQTIGTLLAGASLAGLYSLGGFPMVVFIGSEIGLVVIRSMSAVGAVLWQGARPEVEAFGGDAAAKVLDAIRRKLGIQRRRR